MRGDFEQVPFSNLLRFFIANTAATERDSGGPRKSLHNQA